VQREEIEKLLDTPEEELLERFGFSISPPNLQGIGNDRFTYIEIAKRWLDIERQNICDKLKQSKLVCDFVNARGSHDRIELFSSIVDVISTITSVGLPVFLCAALIVKKGLKELCGNDCFV